MEETKFKVSVIHLVGETLRWHQGFMRIQAKMGKTVTWPEYTEVLEARFKEELFGDPVLEMKHLLLDGSLSKYRSRFDSLLY